MNSNPHQTFWLIVCIINLIIIAFNIFTGVRLNGYEQFWGTISLFYISATVVEYVQKKKGSQKNDESQ